MNKKNFGVAMFFSTTIFIIIIVTFFLAGGIGYFLIKVRIVDERYPILILAILCILCLITGLVFSKVVSNFVFRSLFRINDATKHVSNGNYNIRISEDSHVMEINEIAHNFNIMVKELASTEILQHNFVENVSHEFKTPLSAIEGYATMLQNTDLSNEKRLEYSKKIIESTKRLSSLSGNILLLSKLENQETILKKEKFNLSEQIREEILILENQWIQKNIYLDIYLEEVDVNGSEELLSQVWQNIIGNAIKFSKNNSIIKISLERRESYVILTIEDEGIGMGEEAIKRVFDKFYQEDTSRATTGNGLGLTLVKKIIDLHGGKIKIDSEIGKGTIVQINLHENF